MMGDEMEIQQSGRVAIRTRYYGPTNYRGSRIVAWRGDERSPARDEGSVTIPYPHELSGSDCHAKAIRAYIDKRNADDARGGIWTWDGVWRMAACDDGYVAVWIGEEV